MGKIKKATQWMIDIANDNSHGYSQSVRFGPSYDCSSLVIQAWENAGVPVKTRGATYTGNMYSVFTQNGFSDVTSQVNLSSGNGLQYGDICLNHQSHVVAYIGNGQIVHARSGEGTCDTIDNSGNEIRCQNYWNFPWDCILRYTQDDDSEVEIESVAQDSSPESQESDDTAAVNVTQFNEGDIVSITGTTYYNGVTIPSWVRSQNWIVMSQYGDRVVINQNEAQTITIMSPINAKDLVLASSKSETASTNTAAGSKNYTVVRGDTLWGIARSQLGDGLRYTEIKELNGLTSDLIYPGQVLQIPE